MKNRTHFIALFFWFAGVFVILASSCEKENDDKGQQMLPELTTADISEFHQATAVSGGIIIDDRGSIITARGVCWSTTDEPTIHDNITEDGIGGGSFTSSITGLDPNTTYYIRAYATNSEGTGYGDVIEFTAPREGNGFFTDARDDNVYKTVTIGNQVWMAENLAYLPWVVGGQTGSMVTPCYYVYSFYTTDANTAKTTWLYNSLGVLYNWPAAINGEESSDSNPSGVQGVCPAGWHLPSVAQWDELFNYLGADEQTGGKLKEVGYFEYGTGLWYIPNTGATNESGFTAVPGGHRSRYYSGDFFSGGYHGSYWSSTISSTDDNRSGNLFLSYDKSSYEFNYTPHDFGLSVRCLRDN